MPEFFQDIHLFDALVLMGAVQGFISCVILFRQKKNTLPNRILATLILLISMACLNIFMLETVPPFESRIWHVITETFPLIIIMPIGPLLYCYVFLFSNKTSRLPKGWKKHFLSVSLDLFPYCVFLIFEVGTLLFHAPSSDHEKLTDFVNQYEKYVDIPRFISLTVYSFMSYRLFRNTRETLSIDINSWLFRVISAFALFLVIWLPFLTFYLIPSVSQLLLKTLGWYPVYLPLVLLVYWLGINGYSKSKLSPLRKGIAVLPNPMISEKLSLLKLAMEQEKLFLNPSLSLANLAEHTQVPPKEISYVLNQHVGKSFNEFINEFRVSEVQRKMADPNYQHLTITGIAFESGFNSQATFQRAFKSVTSKSPREYQKTLKTAGNSTQI